MPWDETDWKRLERMLDCKQDKETCEAYREGNAKSIDKMPGLSRAVEKNSTDIGWLKRAFWAMVGGTVTVFGGLAILAASSVFGGG